MHSRVAPVEPRTGGRVGTRSGATNISAFTPTTSSSEKRQIVRPNPSIPWSVDVVNAVPKAVEKELDDVVTSASCRGWACVGLRNGNFLVWQSTTFSLSETLKPPKHCAKIFFPDLIMDTDEGAPESSAELRQIQLLPLISLSSSRDGSLAYLYAAHPRSGWVAMKKISPADLRSRLPVPVSHSARTKIELRNQSNSRKEISDGEYLTSLAASDNMVVVGSSHGRLIWLTPTVIPIGLHHQLIPMPSNTSGIWNRISSIVSSTSDTDHLVSEHIVAVVPLSPKSFISVSRWGNVTKWDVQLSVAAAHHAVFEPTQLGNLSSFDLDQNESFSDLTVLDCTPSQDFHSLHFITRTSTELNNTTSSPNSSLSSSCKIHWIEVDIKSEAKLLLMRSFWLNRFPVPERVEVLGIVACDGDYVCAAFSSERSQNTSGLSLPVIIMALPEDSNHVHEVDLPTKTVPLLILGSLGIDEVTHGCLAIAVSGVGIRIRFMAPSGADDQVNATSNPMAVETLVSHLRSFFWHTYDSSTNDERTHHLAQQQIPPSLRQARSADLEKAVICFALELQAEGESSSTLNPLEQHIALITMLQQSGLYRSLTQLYRWKFLGIGQELAVYRRLMMIAGSSSWERENVGRLKTCSTPEWLLRIRSGETQDSHKRIWMNWFIQAWTAASEYRNERALLFYDISSARPPSAVRLWTSHKSIQTILWQQLKEWEENLAAADRDSIEKFVEAALQSFEEHHADDVTSRETYTKVRAQAIGLLRSVGGDADELAFALSVRYSYFEGLCKISADHEKKLDANQFSLEPLFETIQNNDTATGYTFTQYALQWHTDMGMFGHALNYGRHSSTDLNHIMQSDDHLHPYRWIQAVRQHDHKASTDSLIANSTLSEASLATRKWHLSMAKLANRLDFVSPSIDVESRKRGIERKLELMNAQQLLLEGEMSPKELASSPVLPPETLIDRAIDRLDQVSDIDERTKLCFIALVVCVSVHDASVGDSAARIWAKCIEADIETWLGWVQSQEDYTNSGLCSTALNTTLFGSLLQECRSDIQLKPVTYNPHMEKDVTDKLMIEDVGVTRELCRLLRHVVHDPAISAESLVVSSYA